MHEPQFVKARAGTLEGALEAFGEHVKARGGEDNWWKWELALLPSGKVMVREPDDEELRRMMGQWLEDPSERQKIENRKRWRREATRATQVWRDSKRWQREPWLAVCRKLALAGAAKISLDDRLSAAERKLTRTIRGMAPERLPSWFLKQAHARLCAEYPAMKVPPREYDDWLRAPTRRDLSSAFEVVYELVLSKNLRMDDLADELPYRAKCSPYEWPAHLVGDGQAPGQTVFLQVDMHC